MCPISRPERGEFLAEIIKKRRELTLELGEAGQTGHITESDG